MTKTKHKRIHGNPTLHEGRYHPNIVAELQHRPPVEDQNPGRVKKERRREGGNQ
jgi:hypothetical protein